MRRLSPLRFASLSFPRNGGTLNSSLLNMQIHRIIIIIGFRMLSPKTWRNGNRSCVRRAIDESANRKSPSSINNLVEISGSEGESRGRTCQPRKIRSKRSTICTRLKVSLDNLARVHEREGTGRFYFESHAYDCETFPKENVSAREARWLTA